MNVKMIKPTIMTAILATTTSALALPDFSAKVPENLTKEAADISSLIIADSDAKTLYVGPAPRKVVTGEFSPAADADHCEMLESLYAMTYRVPTEPQNQWADIAKAGPVSPFFDMNFGNYEYFATLIRAAAAAANAEITYQTQHAREYAAYVKAKDLFDARELAVITIQEHLNALTAHVTSAATMLSVAQGADGVTAARDALREAQERLASEGVALKSELREAIVSRETFRGPYIDAKAAWAPYMPKAMDLSKTLRDLTTTLHTVDALAKEAFATAKETLMREEGRVVGFAAVTTSLYDTEVQDVRAFPSANGYSVVPLPVFDVAIGRSSDKFKAVSDGLGVSIVDYSNVDRGGRQGPGPLTFAMSGRPMLNILYFPKDGLQTIHAPVSRGAYCMGTKGARAISHLSSKQDGRQIPWLELAYRARTSPVFTDSVGMSYQYGVKAAPASVKCELKLESFSDFDRNAGQVTGLFYARAWDDTTHNAANDQGIKCEVKNLAGPGTEDMNEKLAAVEKRYMQDIAAQFILTYGRSWVVSAGDDSVVSAPVRAKALSEMGSSMTSLCGPNPYCKISGLVLKSLDEIFDTRSGSTSRHDNFHGSITRDYSLTTWAQVQGDATIDVEVRP